MTAQPTLFDAPTRPTLAERYHAWRASVEGQEVAGAISRAALDLAASGAQRISINLLFEQFRQTRRWDLDNSFRAPLARELLDRYPELAGRIEIRHLKAQP